MSGDRWQCATCGEWHEGPVFAWASDRPDAWYDVPEDKRDADVLLSSDECVIAYRFFFLRGNIEIPIHGRDESFSWGVWVSLSENNFDRYHDLWKTEGREKMLSPMFGWLNSSLAAYPSTLNLKTNVYVQPVGIRPLIELEPTDHPLALEQQQGISMDRVREINALLLHHESDS